jgi:hypothetical protein
VPKGVRRLPQFDANVLSLYARGMTVREIQGHLEQLYQVEVSPAMISTVTDAVLAEVTAWQQRPLDRLYPVVIFDALRVKIRDEGIVRNKAVYLALGIDRDGQKDILGLWIEQTEGAAFWLRVMTELKSRGARRHPRRVGRWPGRLPRGDHDGLPASPGAPLRRPPRAPEHRVRAFEGAQARGVGAPRDLSGAVGGGGRGGARGVW